MERIQWMIKHQGSVWADDFRSREDAEDFLDRVCRLKPELKKNFTIEVKKTECVPKSNRSK